ncbi:MAG: hypothetical protein LCH37_13985 [Bacteroidetes bacterium]|nr:hypothetical protein [Bacteroidota bacterium]
MKPLLQKSSYLDLLLLLLAGKTERLYGHLAASVTVGPGETYTSFTNTGGLFAALINSGMNQNLTAKVNGNITETGTNNLNQLASPHKLTIRPNSATESAITITLQDTLFVYGGSDCVTIDGFNFSEGFTRLVGIHAIA